MIGATFQETLAAFPGRRALVIGDVMLDEYIWGEVRRISPEAPVPVVEIHRRTYVPGGAANTAVNVVSLGGEAVLGGVVGRDHGADCLAAELDRVGVRARQLLVDEARLTTTKTRIVAHQQQVVRVDSEQRRPLPTALEDRFIAWVQGELRLAQVCVLSDYAKGVLSPRLVRQVLTLAKALGRPTVVDPKGTDYAKYRGATVIKPNLHEAEQVLRREISGEEALLEAGRQLGALLEGSAVLLTRGAQGMSLFRVGEAPVHIPSVAREVFDVTGAGDTVVSTLALALAAGATLEHAAEMANHAAGVVVAKVGTTAITLAELQAAGRDRDAARVRP